MIQSRVQLCKRFINASLQRSNTSSKFAEIKELELNKLIMNQKRVLRKLNYDISFVKLQVLGSGAPGMPICIFMSTDHINYMFNCGEGTQRLANEYGSKLSKLQHIFLTRPSWKNIGGLPGTLLTMQETGIPAVNIHCMGTIQEFINAIQQFITITKLKVSYAPINELEPYEDEVITVHYVPITKTSTNTQKNPLDLTDKRQHSSNKHGKRVIDVAENESLETEAKKFKGNADLLCFICKIQAKPGKLLADRCKALGIQPGPLYKLLKIGENVKKEDGTIVYSKDVCLPPDSSNSFIVVECPTIDYIDSLVNHSAFSKYQNTSSTQEEEDKVYCIFHITPEEIFNSPQYQDWMNKFSSDTQHIILNSKNCGISSEAVHKNQHLLHMLHPEIFPLLREDSSTESEETKNANIHRGQIMQTLQLFPRAQYVTAPNIESAAKIYLKEINEIFGFQETFLELNQNISRITEKYDLTNVPEYPRVVMLGTGSSVPNKIRNTSGILLRIDEDNSILLDCGEGTLSQMIKFYGNSEVDNVLRSIKAIYVSHMHADHHIGLIDILQRRGECTNDNLFVLAPHELATWLNFYNETVEPISNLYTFVNNFDLNLQNSKLTKCFKHVMFNLLNVKEINTIYVRHCKHAYGIAVILNDGKKIVYSGDTMPCDNLIRLGRNCDLLIHEATMEDKLKPLAIQKFHSTISDAINAGKLMNAKFTLLTHFSQRYAKIPVCSEAEENVGLAYDNMDIKLSQLPLLHLFYPCLKLAYGDSCKVVKNSDVEKLVVV